MSEENLKTESALNLKESIKDTPGNDEPSNPKSSKNTPRTPKSNKNTPRGRKSSKTTPRNGIDENDPDPSNPKSNKSTPRAEPGDDETESNLPKSNKNTPRDGLDESINSNSTKTPRNGTKKSVTIVEDLALDTNGEADAHTSADIEKTRDEESAAQEGSDVTTR